MGFQRDGWGRRGGGAPEPPDAEVTRASLAGSPRAMDGARPVLGPRMVGEGRPGRHAHLPAPPSFFPADRSAGRPVRTKHLCSPGWSHIWDMLPGRWGSRRRLGGSRGAGQGNEQPEARGPLPMCGPGPPQFPHLCARPPRDVRGRGSVHGQGWEPGPPGPGGCGVSSPFVTLPASSQRCGRQQLWSPS